VNLQNKAVCNGKIDMVNFFKSSKIFKNLCQITVIINHGNDVEWLCRIQPNPHIERRTQHQDSLRLSRKNETLLEEHPAHSMLKKGNTCTNLTEIRKARREICTQPTASLGLQIENQRRQLHFTHIRPEIWALYHVEHVVTTFLTGENSLKILAVCRWT
jgi:hypothetical protein